MRRNGLLIDLILKVSQANLHDVTLTFFILAYEPIKIFFFQRLILPVLLNLFGIKC